jgi:hypothetical protein
MTRTPPQALVEALRLAVQQSHDPYSVALAVADAMPLATPSERDRMIAEAASEATKRAGYWKRYDYNDGEVQFEEIDIDAILATIPASVQGGPVAVPPKMLGSPDAHEKAPKSFSWDEVGCWVMGWDACREAMLSVAPQPPVQPAQPTQPQPLYDWSQAPEWVEWAATDAEGKKYEFESEPYCFDETWVAAGGHWRCAGIGQPGPHWRETKQRRPGVEPIADTLPTLEEAAEFQQELYENLNGVQYQNVGHGHVNPRPDGFKTRCGGPNFCRVCQHDLAAKRAWCDSVTNAQEPVCKLDGVDEYGPILHWHTHWTSLPTGTEFYTAPPSQPVGVGDEREAFEEWARKTKRELWKVTPCDGIGEPSYDAPGAASLWAAWQARAALAMKGKQNGL